MHDSQVIFSLKNNKNYRITKEQYYEIKLDRISLIYKAKVYSFWTKLMKISHSDKRKKKLPSPQKRQELTVASTQYWLYYCVTLQQLLQPLLHTRPSIWQKKEKKRENNYHLIQCQKLHEDDFEIMNSKTTFQVPYEKWLMHTLYFRGNV